MRGEGGSKRDDDPRSLKTKSNKERPSNEIESTVQPRNSAILGIGQIYALLVFSKIELIRYSLPYCWVFFVNCLIHADTKRALSYSSDSQTDRKTDKMSDMHSTKPSR